jgi:hypothetical protein
VKFIRPLAANGLDQPIAQARQEITVLTAKEISGFAALLLVGGLFADSALLIPGFGCQERRNDPRR